MASTKINGRQATFTPSTGTVAGIPATGNAGRLYLPTNGIAVYEDSGTAWLPWGPLPPLTDPTLPTWSWVNQGPASVDTTKGGVYLSTTGGASAYNLNARVKAQPATPYHAVFGLMYNFNPLQTSWGGVCFRESATGKLVCWAVRNLNAATSASGSSLAIDNYNSPTSVASTPSIVDLPLVGYGGPLWLRLGNDGTNLTFDVGVAGLNWVNVYSKPKAVFMTTAPDQIGFFVDSYYTNPFGVWLISYQETA